MIASCALGLAVVAAAFVGVLAGWLAAALVVAVRRR